MIKRVSDGGLGSEQERVREHKPGGRFYSNVEVFSVPDGYGVALDSRPVNTPGKRPLLVPQEELAIALADEWRAQVALINPNTMPLTKIANTSIDGVAGNEDLVRSELQQFVGSDLLCYRATHPRELVERQSSVWDPVLTWAQSEYGIKLQVCSGLMPIRQDEQAVLACSAVWADAGPLLLGGTHTLVTLSGSCILALAVGAGYLDVASAWDAAHVDEDWQIAHWGEDSEAKARREARFCEFSAAAQFVRLLR
ncbi:MAG: ATP12 family chaperone protein [Hyphomicrobiaceae bacterium]